MNWVKGDSKRGSISNQRDVESRARRMSYDSFTQESPKQSDSKPVRTSHRYSTNDPTKANQTSHRYNSNSKLKNQEPMEDLKDDLSAATLKLLQARIKRRKPAFTEFVASQALKQEEERKRDIEMGKIPRK